MIKVAIVSSGLVPIPPIRGGAVEEYVYQLTKYLNKLGLQAIAVDILSDKGHYEDWEVPIIRIPAPSVKKLPKERIIREYVFGLKASKIIKSLHPDIVHANTAYAGFALALTLKKKPLIYTCHNPLWPEERVHASERIVRLIEGYVMHRSNAVIALNKTMKKHIVEKAKINPCKVHIIPNGVDVEFFKPGIPVDDVIDRYGLQGKRVILFVGRVTHWKGVHLLLKAFSRLIEDHKDLKLVIVGPLTEHFGDTKPTPYANVLIEYARKSLPSDSYVFTGAVDREILRKLYATAYVHVLPSYAEAFGMVLIEAMASGCPVIASTAGGIPDIVVDGFNGLLFRKGDWRDLMDRLRIVLEDVNSRNKLATNSRKIAVEKYSWNAVALKMKEIYTRTVM